MTSFDIIINVISANQNFSSTFSMHWYSNSRDVVASSSSFSRPAVRAPGELARRLLCLLPSIWKYEWGKWRQFLARINSDRTLRKRIGKRSEQRCVVAFEPVMTGWYSTIKRSSGRTATKSNEAQIVNGVAYLCFVSPYALRKILSQAPPRSTTSRKLYQENKDAQVDKPASFSFIAEPRIHHISSYKLALLCPKFARERLNDYKFWKVTEKCQGFPSVDSPSWWYDNSLRTIVWRFWTIFNISYLINVRNSSWCHMT